MKSRVIQPGRRLDRHRPRALIGVVDKIKRIGIGSFYDGETERHTRRRFDRVFLRYPFGRFRFRHAVSLAPDSDPSIRFRVRLSVCTKAVQSCPVVDKTQITPILSVDTMPQALFGRHRAGRPIHAVTLEHFVIAPIANLHDDFAVLFPGVEHAGDQGVKFVGQGHVRDLARGTLGGFNPNLLTQFLDVGMAVVDFLDQCRQFARIGPDRQKLAGGIARVQHAVDQRAHFVVFIAQLHQFRCRRVFNFDQRLAVRVESEFYFFSAFEFFESRAHFIQVEAIIRHQYLSSRRASARRSISSYTRRGSSPSGL